MKVGDVKIRVSDLAKRDEVRLFAKRDTQVQRILYGKNGKEDKIIRRKVHEGTMIMGSFSMPTKDGVAVVFVQSAVGGNTKLAMDYYWLKAEDFDWEVYVPVETKS
jgi:hypothetical protein